MKNQYLFIRDVSIQARQTSVVKINAVLFIFSLFLDIFYAIFR